MKFRNPFDDTRDIPALGVSVAAGDTVEATGDHADSLLAQGWPRVDKPKSRNTDEKKD